MGILDTLIDAKRIGLGEDFEPKTIVERILARLKEREKQIITKRHGLLGSPMFTLEAIGKELKLTRERVRQIEKQLLQDLKKQVKELEHFQKHAGNLRSIVSDRGGVMAEVDLLETLGVKAVAEANAVRFLLLLTGDLEKITKNKHIKDGWKTLGFDAGVFGEFLDNASELLRTTGKPHALADLLKLIKASSFYQKYQGILTEQVIENYLTVASSMGKNPLGEYGFIHWSSIVPKDVGDRAFLALRHKGAPMHYRKIADLINDLNFSSHKAHPETVHNELIKDPRFILVGRGTYALAEWGYTSGTVSEVIEQILRVSGVPVSREEIISEVLRRRMVKRNTILVSLANRSKFKKDGQGGYFLAQ